MQPMEHAAEAERSLGAGGWCSLTNGTPHAQVTNKRSCTYWVLEHEKGPAIEDCTKTSCTKLLSLMAACSIHHMSRLLQLASMCRGCLHASRQHGID